MALTIWRGPIALSWLLVLGCVGAKRKSDGYPVVDNQLKISLSFATTPKAQLGAILFHDIGLSRDSSLSCATCHIPSYAYAEPRERSHGIGVNARRRNTPSLIGVGSMRVLDWDGRASDLANQLHGVFSGAGDMGIDLAEAVSRVRANRGYVQKFQKIYQRAPDTEAFLEALADFQRSLAPGTSSFERFYDGDSSAMPEAAKRGWTVFKGFGCAGCHRPFKVASDANTRVVFTDGDFHNIGVGYVNGRMSDIGRFAITLAASDWGVFRSPSLLNVSLTAPYMHDGSLSTLEEVVGFYMKGGNANQNIDELMIRRNLSPTDSSDLVAFLGTLTTYRIGSHDAKQARELLRGSRHQF